MLFLPVWWKWLHRKRRKELLEIMSEQNRQEEAARNDRQRLEQQAVESRQLSERALAEERQRQEIRRMQDEQRRQDSQRQEEQRRQDEQRRQEERRRQEQRAQEERRKQERQQREDSQRQEQEPAREERLKEEIRHKDDKTPQSQELRDLANTEDKYMRLVKSGYYDEKRAEKAAEKTEGGNGMEQMKEAPTKGGFSERREALKTKVQDALRKQEHSKTHDIGHSR